MKKFAYLFPGQGAQYSGMAADLLSSYAVKTLFDTASRILGKDIKELLNSDNEILKRTDVSQPAITAASLAAAAFLGEKGISPSVCAGFSLGEYAAFVCAGIIDAADCLRLVKARGEIMQKVSDNLCGQNESQSSGMAAVTGLDPLYAEELLAERKEREDAGENLKHLFIANINSPKQFVISGTASALAEAETFFKEAGAKRVLRLRVAGPFHSPLMNEAGEAFTEALETVNFRDPAIPVFSNVTGNQIFSGAQAKELALRHITEPVRWLDEEAAVIKSGVEACLETGPGKVLQGLWKDSGSVIPIYACGSAEEINRLSSI